MNKILISTQLIRDQVVRLIDDIVLDDKLQVQSIQTLDQLTLDNHSDQFKDETNKAIEQLTIRSNKYQKLSDYIKTNGCSDLNKLKAGLIKEAHDQGHTYLTSTWHYKMFRLIDVLESFKRIGIDGC